MEETSGRRRSTILTEMEIHLEAIQRLAKEHEEQRNSQELEGQVCESSKSKKCENSSFSTIFRHIDMIHQVINEEKTNLQVSPSSFDQQNVANPGEGVSVFDTSSIEKALNNSLVLRTIMQHSASKDLLNVRLVAKKWEEEATIELLSTRQDIQVSFSYFEDEHEFLNKVGSLEEFTNSCYGNPLRKFPCSQFEFNNVATMLEIDETPPDLFNFFSNHGRHIKSLCLDSSGISSSALSVLRKIIFDWTPNLRYLTISGGFENDEDEESSQGYDEEEEPSQEDDEDEESSQEDDEDEESSQEDDEEEEPSQEDDEDEEPSQEDDEEEEPSQEDDEDEEPSQEDEDKSKSTSDNGLKPSKLSLEHLNISSYLVVSDNSVTPQAWSHLIQDILLSAPNLKTIFCNDLWFAKEIVSTGKIGAAHHVQWAYYNQLMMERFDEFSQARPQLTFLDVDPAPDFSDNPPNSMLPALLLILQSSRDTLKTLKLHGRFDLIYGTSQVELPVMNNLQEFVVMKWNSLEVGHGRILPERSSLQKSFPRLIALHIDDVGGREINGNPFGYSCNASTTVQKLTIGTPWDDKYRFEPSWLGQALVLYPNVRVLHLDCREAEMRELCRAIWTSWNDSLLEELSISLPAFENEDCTSMVDHALTGFDLETCKILWKQRCCSHGGENMERGPSILDMTKLKLFALTCDSYNPEFPMYSRVSEMYAFEPMRRMQNLRVKIRGVELKESIQDCSL